MMQNFKFTLTQITISNYGNLVPRLKKRFKWFSCPISYGIRVCADMLVPSEKLIITV